MEFAEKLRWARERNGYSINDFSSACGISRSSLLNYEKGKVVPNHRNLKRLSSYLHISWYFLLTESCYFSWQGRYSQGYADRIWESYGKKDALQFQHICISTENMPRVKDMDPHEKNRLYASIFSSYCELKEQKKKGRRTDGKTVFENLRICKF